MQNLRWPTEYFQNPNPNEPIEKIWDTIDGYTFEERYISEEGQKKIDWVLPLLPLDYKGKVTKGFFYSQAVDVIIDRFPRLKEIFFPIANSMFASYPYSRHADCFFTCYENKAREAHYKAKYQDRKNVIMLPLQDADFLDEYTIAPTPFPKKTIDVFCVSTAYPVKNIPVIAQAIKIYEEKYGQVLKVVYAIGSRDAVKRSDGTMDYSKMRYDAVDQLKQVDKILGDTKKYIDFYPYIEYKDLSLYYSSAKCCVLASLLEGKNRFISEAMSCNTPVIVFNDFNKYPRCGYPVFEENSGEYIPEFTPESMADTIHKVINNQEYYEPRKNYLKYRGRMNFVNKVVDRIPYYKDNLPDFQYGRIQDNIWVDLATQANYQLSYHDFLYGKNYAILHVQGIAQIESLAKFFYSRFGLG